MAARFARPDGFDDYWQAVDEDLATIEGRPELTLLPMRSSTVSNVYALRLTSIGPTRIFGYFSVPAGDGGPYPALMQTPGYGSVNHIPDYNDRQRYVCLVIMHRGQRLADEPWAAAYPGLLTTGIDSPETYCYRSIVADCLQGAEFLLSRREVDPARVAISGDHLAVITAARRTGFTDLLTDGGAFNRLGESYHVQHDYPVEEINDYLRQNPEVTSAVERTLSFFDPLHHAEKHTGRTLFVQSGNQAWNQPLIDRFGGDVELYRSVQESRTDADAIDEILAGRFDVPPMSRFIQEFESSSIDSR